MIFLIFDFLKKQEQGGGKKHHKIIYPPQKCKSKERAGMIFWGGKEYSRDNGLNILLLVLLLVIYARGYVKNKKKLCVCVCIYIYIYMHSSIQSNSIQLNSHECMCYMKFDSNP